MSTMSEMSDDTDGWRVNIKKGREYEAAIKDCSSTISELKNDIKDLKIYYKQERKKLLDSFESENEKLKAENERYSKYNLINNNYTIKKGGKRKSKRKNRRKSIKRK